MDLKTNSVLIFKNSKKNGDTHPDYKGEIDVNGKRFDIALWEKEGSKGKFFYGKISEPWIADQMLGNKKQSEPPAGIYEKTGKLDRPISKEDLQDDTPTDENDLPF